MRGAPRNGLWGVSGSRARGPVLVHCSKSMPPPPSSTPMVRAVRAEVGPVDQVGFLEGTAGQLEPGPRFSPYLVPGPGTWRGGAERLLLVLSPVCLLQPHSYL